MSRQRILTASSVMLLCSVMAVTLQPVRSQSVSPSATKAMVVSPKMRVAYSKVTPPQGGVRLLQDIFNRVRSAPQIAMYKSGAKKIAESQQLINQAGPTDYKRAIRPKEQGKNLFIPAPQLQILATSEKESSLTRGLSGATNGTIGPGVSMEVASNALPQSNMSKFINTPGDNFRADANAKLRAKINQQGQATLSQSVVGGAGGNAFGDMTASHAGKFKARGVSMAPKSISQPVPLPVAVGRLGGALNDMNKKMEEADKIAADAPTVPLQISNKPQTSLLKAKSSSTAARRAMDERQYGNEGQSFSQTGVVAIVPSQMQNSTANGRLMKTYVQENRGGRRPPSSTVGIWEPEGKDSGAANTVVQSEDSSDAFTSSFEWSGTKKQASDRDLIALLPPNVVTGIPLIRLGISEAQASSALAQIGKMKVEQVSNWKVWTWSKPAEKDAALQLYVRHGLLDAMRIFDRSLIGSDFGVTLGDDLSKVKEKFGEPAFMVQEPSPGAGQNYIYPISQVGFQIARQGPDQQPRVVSVLIFHVK